MNIVQVEKIANAVLYEGYILYPYRPSSVKNQQRWNFGALCPQSYSLAQGGTEAWQMQTECLVQGSGRTTLDVKVRFLHLVAREIEQLTTPLPELQQTTDYQLVDALEVCGRIYQTWQEAVERDASLLNLDLNSLVAAPQQRTFSFPASEEIEALRDESHQVVGVIVRKQQCIEGTIEITAERIAGELFKLGARILNLTPLENAHERCRDEALMRSLVSTHTILSIRGGEFVSLLEPPEKFREAAASCQNTGTWPVLVGEEGTRDCVLSSPIILYDYPQIAPESAGDLFDGTEIDEILTLRIMTLTDEEKREMRGVDDHARKILERTEQLPAEHLMKLHGAMRNLRPHREDER